MILCVHLILLPFLQFKNHKSCFWIKEGLSFLCRHALTKVESQRVIQISAGFMIFFSIFGTIDQNILCYLINSALWHWYFTSFSNILYMIELENSCWWTIVLSLSLSIISRIDFLMIPIVYCSLWLIIVMVPLSIIAALYST